MVGYLSMILELLDAATLTIILNGTGYAFRGLSVILRHQMKVGTDFLKCMRPQINEYVYSREH